MTIPAQAPDIVKRLQFLGATWVKSYENLDLPRIEALKQAAREAGMGVFGHVPYGLGHEEALLPDSQHLMRHVPPPTSIRRDHVFDRIHRLGRRSISVEPTSSAAQASKIGWP